MNVHYRTSDVQPNTIILFL